MTSRAILAILGNAVDAEDAVQEIFLKVQRGIASVGGDSLNGTIGSGSCQLINSNGSIEIMKA